MLGQNSSTLGVSEVEFLRDESTGTQNDGIAQHPIVLDILPSGIDPVRYYCYHKT